LFLTINARGSIRAGGGALMFLILEVVTVFLVALAMSLSLAHALELPG
jgi:NADH:ubiquinone oxidoreductase subunit 3 (subunit A)